MVVTEAGGWPLVHRKPLRHPRLHRRRGVSRAILTNRSHPMRSNGRMEMSDHGAVAAVRAGDREAFRLLVEKHSRTIFKLGFRMTGNEQDAEEVVQETFLRAYRKLDHFESRANFGTWLYRIATNCSFDLLERRKPM